MSLSRYQYRGYVTVVPNSKILTSFGENDEENLHKENLFLVRFYAYMEKFCPQADLGWSLPHCIVVSVSTNQSLSKGKRWAMIFLSTTWP